MRTDLLRTKSRSVHVEDFYFKFIHMCRCGWLLSGDSQMRTYKKDATRTNLYVLDEEFDAISLDSEQPSSKKVKVKLTREIYLRKSRLKTTSIVWSDSQALSRLFVQKHNEPVLISRIWPQNATLLCLIEGSVNKGIVFQTETLEILSFNSLHSAPVKSN